MNSCSNIYNQYKRNSRITENGYIDPEGYKYDTRSIVTCQSCMFHIYHDSCMLYKEQGVDEHAMKEIYRNVSSSNFCDYFLKKDFSEGDTEDEEVRAKVITIAKNHNYPSEYWDRVNASKASGSPSSSSEEDGSWMWFALTYLYLVPTMIWVSFSSGFNYTFKEFFRAVFSPLIFIKHNEYWMAACVVGGSIASSFLLLMGLGMLSDTIEHGVWDTDTNFDGKVFFAYILIFALFFVVPLTRPW